MITILITLWLHGYDVTLDAKEIYNVNSVSECEEILPLIKMEYGAYAGNCSTRDILRKGKST
jgi:hypothetical protein